MLYFFQSIFQQILCSKKWKLIEIVNFRCNIYTHIFSQAQVKGSRSVLNNAIYHKFSGADYFVRQIILIAIPQAR